MPAAPSEMDGQRSGTELLSGVGGTVRVPQTKVDDDGAPIPTAAFESSGSEKPHRVSPGSANPGVGGLGPGVSTPSSSAIQPATPGGHRSVRDSNRPSRAGSPPEISLEEQTILANIQELQRQLCKVKAENEEKDAEEDTTDGEAGAVRRVIIVANRLPVTGKKDPATGEWSFRMSSGGLVTALRGSREELRAVWIGWLGQEVPKEEQQTVTNQLLKEYNAVPVFVSDDLANRYYNGFSNDVLWPLFHYVPLPMYQANAHQNARFDKTLWEAYKEANILFADAVAAVVKDDDYVWIHDYHLMYLPLELRKRFTKANIGWFLHTPFPSSEIYRILPERKELLEALLASDLVGFHTYDYARHFLSACTRILEIPTAFKGLEYNNHFTSLGVFPIGIDPDHVTSMLQKKEVHTRIRELMDRFAGRRLLLGVDRLDYIKGMPHKLLAFERFLTRFPEWKGKVTLIQVGVPSRTEVHEYQRLAERVNELVGRINGTFGTLEYTPVVYLFKSVTQDELFSIYNLADICLVTSLRDGMNLVSYEYVASQVDMPGLHDHQQKEGPGVLVLSELAGSAESMPGAIRINPWNTEEVCLAIEQALTMSRGEREIRHSKLLRFVQQNTAAWWAKTFVKELRTVCCNKPNISRLPEFPVAAAKEAYENATSRVIVAAYDSLLSEVQSLPQLSRPSEHVSKLLAALAKDPKNTVVVISAHEKGYMEAWLRHLRIVLVAEDGFHYRMPNEDEWRTMVPELDNSWMDTVMPILEYFAERTPGTYVQKKSCSLAWYYRDADPTFGSWQAKDLQIQLDRVLFGLPVQIIQSDHMIEVRHQGATTGMLVESVLRHLVDDYGGGVTAGGGGDGERGLQPRSYGMRSFKPFSHPVDFILCISGNQSHEDMFQQVKALHRQAMEPASMMAPLGAAARMSFALTMDLLASPGSRSRPPSQPTSPMIKQQHSSRPAAQPHRAASEPSFSPKGGPRSEPVSIAMPPVPPPQSQQPPTASTGCDAISPTTDLPAPPLLSPPLQLTPRSSLGTCTWSEPAMARDAKVFTAHVGKDNSSAEFYLEGALQVRRLLLELAAISFRHNSQQ